MDNNTNAVKNLLSSISLWNHLELEAIRLDSPEYLEEIWSARVACQLELAKLTECAA